MQLVETMRYKPEGRAFNSRWCHRNFSLTQSFWPHYGPGVDSASNRNGKVKGLPQQTEVAQGVPGRLRLRIFLKLGTTRVVGCQPYAPAAFTLEEIPGTHF